MESAEREGRFTSILLVLIYLALILLTFWAAVESYLTPMQDGRINGLLVFRFFTIDSNILMALSCLACLPRALPGLFGRRVRLGRGLICLRFVGSVGVSLTFWTVMLFLGPAYGYRYMFYREDLFLHLVDPALCILAFVFLEREERISPPLALWGVLPMLAYGLWYYLEVAVMKNWRDFYGFLRLGSWWAVYLGMALATYLIGLILAWIHNRRLKDSHSPWCNKR